MQEEALDALAMETSIGASVRLRDGEWQGLFSQKQSSWEATRLTPASWRRILDSSLNYDPECGAGLEGRRQS